MKSRLVKISALAVFASLALGHTVMTLPKDTQAPLKD